MLRSVTKAMWLHIKTTRKVTKITYNHYLTSISVLLNLLKHREEIRSGSMTTQKRLVLH